MRQSTMEFNRAKNRAARDRAWQERLDRDPRSDAYQYKVRMEDMANQREIALQQAKNKGLIDVANRNQLGATNRERMSQMGQTGRTGLEQAGMTGRLGNQQDFTTEQNRRKYLQDRINFYSTPEYSKDGMQLLREGLDPELSREAALRDMQLSYGGQSMGNSVPVESFIDDKGIRTWSNRPETLAQITSKRPQQDLLQKGMSGQPENLASLNSIPNQIPFQRNSMETNEVYGPQYRKAINPMSRFSGNRTITPTPFKDIFGDFQSSPNPRYR